MIAWTLAGMVALAVAALCDPLVATAQEGKATRIARIERLSPLSAEADRPNLEAFRKGLNELGWVEGQSFTIEARFADGKPERLPGLAAELVRQRVDVILTGSSPGALAAKKATSTISIVVVTTGDPVRDGLVASLARPGGNVTGVTALGQALDSKRLELLKDAVPGITRVAVLVDPDSYYTAAFLREKEAAGRGLGLELPVLEVRDPATLEKALGTIAAGRVGALMVQTNASFITHRDRIVAQVAKSRLPAVYGDRTFVDAGGLMFYGAGLAGLYGDAAAYTDKILKGARPSDLPVEQPTKLELVINLRTAKALGLTIPPSVLARADHLVER